MTAPVPVLLYHAVSEHPEPWIAPHTVTPRTFVEQLDRIADSGRTVVPLRRLVSALRGGPPVPPHCAVLTFDDGFADFYRTVAQALTDRRLPATLYVTTSAVHDPGRPPWRSRLPPAEMLSRRQIADLDALGVEIGGHSRTHAEPDTLPGHRLGEEIDGCKPDLENAVGRPATAFARPGGPAGPVVRRRVADAGRISAALAGTALSSPTDDPPRIARLRVRADTSSERFDAWLRGVGAPVAPLPESFRARGRRACRRIRAALGRPSDEPTPT
ncbi:polysaccharide deacetylase family protein [Kitasatospora sp. NPDC051914]|uniref:polysaccharide deacetylase family protein n=1 Tax=Kitasatospora sp. NPDC051914 TaxID=3154945 RepID=UPI0034449BBA